MKPGHAEFSVQKCELKLNPQVSEFSSRFLFLELLHTILGISQSVLQIFVDIFNILIMLILLSYSRGQCLLGPWKGIMGTMGRGSAGRSRTRTETSWSAPSLSLGI